MTILADSHSHGREPWLAVFGLGGTVASAAGADGGAVPSREIGELLEDSGCIPPGVRVVGTQFRMVASSELTLADIVELSNAIRDAQTAGARGVVVAQGTDTIEETAFALDVLLHDVTIPVVVTGAMRHPSLPGSDAAANLAAALDVATSTAAKNHRVLVVINDEIHTALFVRKAHTTSPSAFSSWPVGAVGFGTPRAPSPCPSYSGGHAIRGVKPSDSVRGARQCRAGRRRRDASIRRDSLRCGVRR